MAVNVPFESRRPQRPALAFSVRGAVVGDARGIADVWLTWHEGDRDDAEAGIAGEVGMARRGDGRLVMVAEHEALIVAYGRARLRSAAEVAAHHNCPAGWWLSGSVVLPEYRRRGIGRALMDKRLEHLRATVHSKVDVANRVSLAWHLASGFEEVTRDFTSPGADPHEPMVLLRWTHGD